MTNEGLFWAIAVAVFLGSILKDFFQAIMSDVVTPILTGIFGQTGSEISGFVVTVGGVKLKIGDVIANTLTLLIAFAIVSFTLPYLRAYTAPIVGGRR
jgi:large-conductance mechanosensitive channel